MLRIIGGIEKTFERKIDDKFNEFLTRLPPPQLAAPNTPLPQQQQQRLPPHRETALCRASRLPLVPGQTIGVVVDTFVAPAADAEEDDFVGDYEDEVDPKSELRAATSTATTRSSTCK